MKIALLLSSFNGGGAERVMVQLANGFANHKIDTTLIVLDPAGPYKNEVAENVNQFNLNIQKSSQAARPLAAWLLKEKPKILLSTQNHINLLGHRAVKKTKGQVKLIIREATTPSKNYAFSKSIKGKLLIKLNGLICKRAAGVVGTSKAVRDDLIDFYKMPRKHVTAIYAPNVSESIFEKAAINPPNKTFDYKKRVILTMGRVAPVKGFDILIKALPTVLKNVSTHLYILGDTSVDDNYYQSLQRLIENLDLKEFVTFLGFDSNPYPYIKNTHVYVLSSKYEGLPGSLVQAMALGANLVSTDCESGPREILKDGKYGALVPVDDYKSLGAEIAKALIKEKSPINPKSYEEFTENYSIGKWNTYFESILN